MQAALRAVSWHAACVYPAKVPNYVAPLIFKQREAQFKQQSCIDKNFEFYLQRIHGDNQKVYGESCKDITIVDDFAEKIKMIQLCVANRY